MKAKRNGTIDLFKFAFTIMIVLFHTGKWFIGGYIAVDFFFIVSGFLMAKSMKKTINNGAKLGTDTVKFVLRKAKGIFPYYISAWIVSFLCTVYIKGIGFFESFTTILRSFYNITMTEMIGNYSMGHRIQASWYISAMLIGIFIIYPFRKRFTDVFDKIVAPIVFLIFIGMAYQRGSGVSAFTVLYNEDLYVYYGLIRGIAELSLGCICFNICEKINKNEYTLTGKILLSTVEWLGILLVFYFASIKESTDMDLALIPMLAISITIAFTEKSLVDKLFTGRAFSWLGSFSLQIYLTHEFVKNLLMPYIFKEFNWSINITDNTFEYMCLFALFTLVAALLCHFLGKFLLYSVNKLAPKLKTLLIKV